MKYDLASLIRRTGTRQRIFKFAPIMVPATFEQRLLRIYQKVNIAWSKAIRETILPAYASFLALSRDDETDSLSLAISASADGVYRVVLPLSADVEAWANAMEEMSRTGWESTVASTAGVDVSVFTVREDVLNQLNASVNSNASLIRSLNEDMYKRVEVSVWQAVQQQTPRLKLAQDLQKSLGISQTRAITIARDQTTKLGASLERARQQEAGLDEYIWIKSGKVHYRPEHAARNGKKYDWDHPPAGGPPGSEINCGCHAQAYLDLGDD